MTTEQTYYVAVWAPHNTPNAEPEFKLNPGEIETLTGQLVGVPVTYDHVGIHDAINTLEDVGYGVSKVSVARAMLVASKDRPEQRPLGIVTDAWVDGGGNGVCAFYTTGNASMSLIKAGALSSVSLTHVAERMQPLELSLCNVPARPGSRVLFSAKSDKEVAAYKARSLLKPQKAIQQSLKMAAVPMNTEATDANTAPAKALTFDEALTQVPEEVRSVLADGLEKLRADLITASKELEESKKEAEAAKTREAIQNTDAVILEDQLKRLLAAMPEQYQDMYMKSVPSLVQGFSSGNPQHAMDAAVRTVMCASRAIQLRDFGAHPADAVSKRQRTTAGSMATEAPAAPAPVVAAPVVAAVEAPAPAAAAAAAAADPATTAAVQAPLSSTERLNIALGRAFD